MVHDGYREEGQGPSIIGLIVRKALTEQSYSNWYPTHVYVARRRGKPVGITGVVINPGFVCVDSCFVDYCCFVVLQNQSHPAAGTQAPSALHIRQANFQYSRSSAGIKIDRSVIIPVLASSHKANYRLGDVQPVLGRSYFSY